MKRSTGLALPLITAGLAACADTPTTPAAAPAKPATEVSAAAFDLKAGLAIAADDARDRVIPTLGDSRGIRAVDNAFRNLGDAIRAGDGGAVRDAIDKANGALKALDRAAPDTDPIEMAALRLVVLNAQVLYPAA
jgi:hypothetical protein